MFTQEELSNYQGVLQVNAEFIEIDCGCTNPRFGDTPGKLRVYPDGKLEIDCTCRTDCDIVNVSPVEFARHAGKINAHANWKSQIWVFNEEWHKTAVWRTCLLKYHRHTFQRRMRQVTHRDEFVRCCHCGKDRRFSLRTKQDCKIYHDALVNPNWNCSNMPNNSLSCNDAEERESRKVNRGCPRTSKCAGCEQCVCIGCEICRFEDCICQTCAEFIMNM